MYYDETREGTCISTIFFTLLRTENLFQIFQFKKIFMFLKMICLGHLSKVVLESKHYVHQYQLPSLNVLIIVTVGKS